MTRETPDFDTIRAGFAAYLRSRGYSPVPAAKRSHADQVLIAAMTCKLETAAALLARQPDEAAETFLTRLRTGQP